MIKLNQNELHENFSKANPFKRKGIHPESIDVKILEDALKTMAEVVKLHGDQYLPAFIRIHDEIELRKKELSYKKIALQIASND